MIRLKPSKRPHIQQFAKDVYLKFGKPITAKDTLPNLQRSLKDASALLTRMASCGQLVKISLGTKRQTAFYLPNDVLVPPIVLTTKAKPGEVLKSADDEYVLRRMHEILYEFYRRKLTMQNLVDYVVAQSEAR